MGHGLTVELPDIQLYGRTGNCWVGIKTHMGYKPGGLQHRIRVAKARETAARRQAASEGITVFTDA